MRISLNSRSRRIQISILNQSSGSPSVGVTVLDGNVHAIRVALRAPQRWPGPHTAQNHRVFDRLTAPAMQTAPIQLAEAGLGSLAPRKKRR
jgi:hypothetical protein